MPRKVILCIFFFLFHTASVKHMTGGLNKTSYVLSFLFHQNGDEEWLIWRIPLAMSLLAQAETEAFLEAAVLPSISEWLA